VRLEGMVTLALFLFLHTAAQAGAVQDCGLLEKQGRLDEAVGCYEPLLGVAADARERIHIHTRLGWIQVQRADFETSLAHFREALALSRTRGDRLLEAKAINSIGFVYQGLRDYPAALDHYQRAHLLAKELGDRTLIGEALYYQGRLALLRGDHPAAVRDLEASLQARRDAGDRAGEGFSLVALGTAAKAGGRLDEALELFQRARVIADEEGDRRTAAQALDHLGIVMTDLGQPGEAVALHRQALELRLLLGSRYEESFSRIGLSLAYERLGQLHEAAAEMAAILDPIEAASRRLSLGRFRAALYGNLRSHHERSVELLAKLHRLEPSQGHDAAAFDASERSRARMTLDSVQEALARQAGDPQSELLLRAGSLRDQLDHAERERDRVVAAGEPAERLREVGARIESLLASLKATEQQVRAAYPGLAEAAGATPFTAAEIRGELLDGDTALVEYFLGEKRSFRWTMTRDGLSFRELPGRAAIEPLAAELHGLLSQGDQRKLHHQVELAARRLSAVALAGLTLPKSVKRIVIVPDGALHYVPFAVLPLDLSSTSEAVIDRFEVTVAPSASALLLMRRMAQARGASEERLAIIADPVFRPDDPRVQGGGERSHRAADSDVLRAATEAGIARLVRLPATRVEAEAIAKLGGTKARKVLDFEASRQRVLNDELNQYTVLHFASHALINPRHHSLSGIILSLVDERGAAVDGFIRVHDLYRLRLRAGLVVLSACRTAMGTELRGEGMVGLVSGFMWAGAPRVVASFWDVKDQATAAFMKHFYRVLLVDGLPAGAAVRKAQLAVKNDPRWRSPYYWGAFTLHGEWQ